MSYDLEYENKFLKQHGLLPAQAIDRVEELQAQVNLIKEAYAEGWHDGYNTTSVSGYEVDWVISETKAAINGDG